MTTDIGFPAPDVFEAELARMVDLRLASRISERDATIWGPDAAELASKRLGWTDLHTRAAGLIEQIDTLRDELVEDGVDRIVLAGMGGSSLGAEVVARAHDAGLVVLDTSDPLDIAALCESDDLDRSAMVVATKSGTTIETVSRGLRVRPGPAGGGDRAPQSTHRSDGSRNPDCGAGVGGGLASRLPH